MDSVLFFLKKQLLSDPAPPSPGETMKATLGGGGGKCCSSCCKNDKKKLMMMKMQAKTTLQQQHPSVKEVEKCKQTKLQPQTFSFTTWRQEPGRRKRGKNNHYFYYTITTKFPNSNSSPKLGYNATTTTTLFIIIIFFFFFFLTERWILGTHTNTATKKIKIRLTSKKDFFFLEASYKKIPREKRKEKSQSMTTHHHFKLLQ
jgi:hypothetical protein